MQDISYDGILECFEQGNELLGGYRAQLVSVHDPGREYLAWAETPEETEERYADVLDAYRALGELRSAGEVEGIGIGSKTWEPIKRVFDDGIELDWVMFANSFTLHSHPPELLEFMAELERRGVAIINSAVFHGGFLLGGAQFDYREVTARASRSCSTGEIASRKPVIASACLQRSRAASSHSPRRVSPRLH